MSVVSFEELVALNVPNHESGPDVKWPLGGGVDLHDISMVGTFNPMDKFTHASFQIRLRSGEKHHIESSDTTAVRKLHAALVLVWVKYSRDSKINPLLDFKD